MEKLLVDFILKSEWYKCRIKTKEREIEVYGKVMSGDISDELYIAISFLSTFKPQEQIISEYNLKDLHNEYIGNLFNHKVHVLDSKNADRNSLFEGWYE